MKRLESYRPDIDGLRALAVLAVVCYHAYPPLLRGGFIGVDIFFVISGYLICGIILNDLEKGTFSLRGFYARRITRIFPALLVVLFSVLAFGWFCLLPDEYMNLGKHAAGGAGFIANLQLWQEVGYWDIRANLKPLLHLWSLGIEEQYYIIFPCLLLLAWKLGFRLTTLLAGLFLVSFIANIHYSKINPSLDFYLPFTRFWELLAGAALAVAARHKNPRLASAKLALDTFFARLFPGDRPNDGRSLNDVLSAAGFLLLALALIVARVDKQFPGWYALPPVGGAVFIIAAGPAAVLNRCILSNRLAVSLGLVSYPFYLWHWPIISYCYILGGEGVDLWIWRFIRLGCIAAALALAFLTYKFVEFPIRFQWKRSAFTISALAALMCCCASLGVYIHWNRGLPDRAAISMFMSEARLDTSERYIITPQELSDLKQYASGFRFIAYGAYRNVNSPNTVAVIGDSHAGSAYDGIAALNAELGLNTLLLHYDVRKQANASAVRQNVITFLVGKKDIHNVFIFFRGVLHLTGHDLDLDEYGYPTWELAARDQFRPILQRTVDDLSAVGKRVFIVSENPVFPYTPKLYTDRPFSFSRLFQKPLAPTKDEVLKHQAEYLAMLKELRGATIIESIDAFCPEDRCLDILSDGSVLYYDRDHLSVFGSLFQAEKLLAPYLEEIAKQAKP